MLPGPLSSAEQRSPQLFVAWLGAQLQRLLRQLPARLAGLRPVPKQAQAAALLRGHSQAQARELQLHWMQASWPPPPPSPACCTLAYAA